jgi:hypothetical protein
MLEWNVALMTPSEHHASDNWRCRRPDLRQLEERRHEKEKVMSEVFVERGKGRTLSVNVRFFTDEIAGSGAGYVKRGHAWFQGDVGFRPNDAHGVKSIGDDPIMFNRPEELVEAILRAAQKQGVVLYNRRTKERLTE